ncbi:hypothetical protein [Isoptericola variabilis]|uniref:Uncharacterized protein n=1 Tax=Isoptericola variabilis (strain 225) TaxID=743718 RepID=F6FRD7_ISOV2|nr:hypothetical protein [Isoptericola variabilis]AEG43898.1 hypothetical protein Isova_1123 [Isoptericola variabilis 225]TWH30488.1 hypothetical protein L600_000300000410 [Isoptericola variabilis J7]
MVDIGESLVGAYMRQVRRCHTVAYNSRPPTGQGEIDVIGVAGHGDDRQVWVAEVATHLDGLLYGSGNADTVQKMASKVATARAYAAEVFPDADPIIELWAPNVPAPLMAALREVDVVVVGNEDFTRRVNELAALASASTRLSGDDAFRMLQLLTHLRGEGRPQFSSP